jgi:hypothetical protein
MEALTAIGKEEEVRLENLLCIVCMEEKKTVACLPCGHVVFCATCSLPPPAQALPAGPHGLGLPSPASAFSSCPVCRGNVLHLCKLFF